MVRSTGNLSSVCNELCLYMYNTLHVQVIPCMHKIHTTLFQCDIQHLLFMSLMVVNLVIFSNCTYVHVLSMMTHSKLNVTRCT